MKILELEQGTADWYEARRCKITGTKLGDVMGSAWEQVMLICDLIAEEGTEQIKQMRPTAEMERGTAEEQFAIKEFQNRNPEKKIVHAGFCLSDEFEFLGLSPDAFIEDNSGKFTEAIEVKSPDSKTAVFYKLSGLLDPKELSLTAAKSPWLGIPSQYKWQIVNYFLVNSDLKKLHFAVYDARFIDDANKLTVVTVNVENELLQDALKQAREKLVEFKARWDKYRAVALPDNF